MKKFKCEKCGKVLFFYEGEEAAEKMGKSQQFVRIGLQRKLLP